MMMATLDRDVDLVRSSFRAVLSYDEEVNCQKDGPDSLKVVSDLFPSSDTTEDTATYQILTEFCRKLLQTMRSAISFGRHVKFKQFQEQSLINFQKLKMETLPLVWQSLSTKLHFAPVNPFHQQAVNRHLFQEVLIIAARSCYPTVATQKPRLELTPEEDNAVRYASGYVAMKVLNKYKKIDTANAVHFVECLSNMASSGNESSFYDYTLQWTESVDRGGLFHINNACFCFFKAIEVKTQDLLPKHLTIKAAVPNKTGSIKRMAEDNDIQFWWSMIAIDIPDKDAAFELLNEILDMWVTMRGFAVVSNWLEQYKIAQKKTVKKSKSLRKTLDPQTT